MRRKPRRTWEEEMAGMVTCERYGISRAELDDLLDETSLEFKKGLVWAMLRVEESCPEAPALVRRVISDCARGYFDGADRRVHAAMAWVLAWVEWTGRPMPETTRGSLAMLDAIFEGIDWRLHALCRAWPEVDLRA